MFGADGCWWIAFRIRSFTDAIPIPLSSSQLRINGGAPAIGGGENSTLDSRLDLFARHAEGGREKAVVAHPSYPERHRGGMLAEVTGGKGRPA